jgi:hypothetical protein
MGSKKCAPPLPLLNSLLQLIQNTWEEGKNCQEHFESVTIKFINKNEIIVNVRIPLLSSRRGKGWF